MNLYFTVFISNSDVSTSDALANHMDVLTVLSRSQSVHVISAGEIPPGCLTDDSNSDWHLHMQIKVYICVMWNIIFSILSR